MHVTTELEKMLDVFNVNKYKTSDKHILEYTGNISDPRIARVVKHLNRAILDNDDLLHAMLVEDEIEAHFERERQERAGEKAAKEVERAAKEAALLKVEEGLKREEAERTAKEAERTAKEESLKREVLLKERIAFLEQQALNNKSINDL